MPTFDPVDPRQSLPDLEEGILQYWKEEDMFKRSVKHRATHAAGDVLDGPRGSEQSFSFYDGPPFATGLPHYGHILAGTIKDVIPRYQTMRGKYVERRFGWDCHGLPIENLIEKEHNIGSKDEIEKMGVAKFNALCRSAVQRYTKEWRTVVERMGRWVDMDWDYRTMDPDFMESMWWAFSALHDKKLIYEGHKPMHICPRCVTPLSNFEVTQGYVDITDQSVTAMFRLEGSEDAEKTEETYVLAWTTTPWTLPGNLFLAVHPDIDYVMFEDLQSKKRYIAAEAFVNKLLDQKKEEPQYTPVGKPFKGKKLIGKRYTPLFPYFAEEYRTSSFRVVEGNFVAIDEGTGVVHIATGFGEDDYQVGLREFGKAFTPLQHVTMEGIMIDAVTDFAGMHVKPKEDPTRTDKKVIEWLKKHDVMFSTESYKHSYPHCWRCDSPLLNYATSSWFVRVEEIKERMLANNAKTHWVPEYIRDGRYGKWLANARDWAISRNRYWGTPLPIWRSEETGDMTVIAGRDQLMREHQIRFSKVTALRHGESDGNLIPVYQGEAPGTDLTERGKEQARTVADFLRDQPVAMIYCSPLARARQTAEIIGEELGVPVVVDTRLREVAFGEFEGRTVDFSDLSFVKERRAHKIKNNRPESIYHFDGMETWESVQERVRSFMQETLPKHRSEHILIVSHADPVQNMRGFFTGEELMKLSHQPYPGFAQPYTFFWDHDRDAQLDLHKDVVDPITWQSSPSKNSVELTLVRHGETAWNAQRKVQGSEVDEPLNDNGRKQAADLGKSLKKQKKFDAIVSSDLSRARETAEILAKELGVPLQGQWMELRERRLGDWSGMDVEEFKRSHTTHIGGINPAYHTATPKDGESFATFLDRMRVAADRLRAEFPGKRVLVVSHNGVVQGLKTVLENLSYAEGLATSLNNGESVDAVAHPVMRRIPEVLDCWFESGSMPYAQQGFPYGFGSARCPTFAKATAGKQSAKSKKVERTSSRSSIIAEGIFPIGFPADFIAEGVDQTRAWFYTLMVLSTALFDETPFKNVIVNGIVLAEDGKKMSKRLKNYPEPMEIVKKYGADAIRFALMSSPAVRAEDLRISEKLISETLRSVLLPLWNTYSFFVTYANAANFEAHATRTTSNHPLDHWIRAEVQDLVNRMTEQFENYDLSATCAELHQTIDALTNWYVRLSRRRFAGKGAIEGADSSGDVPAEEQQAALGTLYDVLLTLAQLLAPFCPFLTEALYINLVPEAHGSIHLTDWPQTRALTKEEKMLLEKTRVIRIIASLGLSIRAEQKVKVRQPLMQATVALPPSIHSTAILSDEDLAVLRQELNVKEIAFAKDPHQLADAFAQVDARKVGPRLGARVQEIIRAGKAGEFTANDDGSILILDETLAPDEATIVYRGKEGQSVAADRGVVVSLDTHVTEDLRREGDARDLIRGVQKLRKEAGLSFTDKIMLQVDDLDDVLGTYSDLIAEETRATLGSVDAPVQQVDVGERAVSVRIAKR